MTEFGFLNTIKKFRAHEDGTLSIQAMPFGEWLHPKYGKEVITPEKAKKLKESFDNRTYGQELFINFVHGEDPAKGDKAAGKILGVEVGDDGLYYSVQPTPTAMKEIADGEWNYFSPEYYDEWVDPRNGEKHEFVLRGGALVNYPHMKGINLINMSELTLAPGTKGECADVEHSEPGTGGAPRRDYDYNPFPTPFLPTNPLRNDPERSPWNDEGSEGAVDEAKILEILGIPKLDENTLKAFREDAVKWRELETESNKVKTFKEQFPDEFEEMQRLKTERLENSARKFSERFKNIDGKGLSPVAIEKIEGMFRKFSEGTLDGATLDETFESIVKTGVVTYGERGSSHTPDLPESDDDAIKQFAEKITAIRTERKLSHGDAISAAARENPDLFKLYQERARARS